MFKFKKLTFLASVFMVGMLLLAACVAEESAPTLVEEAVDTQATFEAVEAAAAAETEAAAAAETEAAAAAETEAAAAAETEAAAAAETEAAAAAETEAAAQATVKAAEATAAAEAEEEMAEELDAVATTEPTSENRVPTKRSEVPRVTVEELKELIDNGEAIVIGDTRSQYSFNRGHIPGAILATESQVESHLNQVPLAQEIILYCTWPNEASSAGAALTLYENGYKNVSALLGGFEEWTDAGYPVEES